MSNETDLDWLARNVHKWPCGKHQQWCYVHTVRGVRWASGSGIGNGTYVRIEQEQWLARRAELQNKPSWADAPEWALSVTQRINGEWFWLGSTDQFMGPSSSSGCCGEVLGDWRDTLELRPVDLSEPAVTERLGEATQTVLAAAPGLMDEKYIFDRNDWFERGELPPVGTECEFWGGVSDADDPWHADLMDGDKVTVIAHFECGICTLAAFTFKARNPNISTVLVEQANYGCFRPIRTERDELIDLFGSKNWFRDRTLCENIADAILAAGFKLRGK